MKKLDKATEEWLNAQKPNTEKTYRSLWRKFMSYVKMDGVQILEHRKHDKEHEWEQKTLEFHKKLKKEKSENRARTASMAVRSFFRYHYSPLVFRRPEKKQLKEATNTTEDYRFTKDELAKMSFIGNLQQKYIVIAGKSFGLRSGDFLKFTKGDLESYIDREPPISIGRIPTQKRNVYAFPFIDYDAQPIIKEMLEKMNREGRTSPNEKMLNITKEGLNKSLQRLAQKAGINKGNKKIRFHCLRKFLTDRLSAYGSESKWKQIIGKKISEGAYVSEELLRPIYMKACRDTCFALNEKISLEMFKNRYEKIISQQAQDIADLKEKVETLDATVLTLMKIIDQEDRTET